MSIQILQTVVEYFFFFGPTALESRDPRNCSLTSHLPGANSPEIHLSYIALSVIWSSEDCSGYSVMFFLHRPPDKSRGWNFLSHVKSINKRIILTPSDRCPIYILYTLYIRIIILFFLLNAFLPIPCYHKL